MTIAFSILQLANSNNMGFREPIFSYSNGDIFLSAPFYINNTGYYDLSDINITIGMRDGDKALARFSGNYPPIPAGVLLNETYDASISLAQIASKDGEIFVQDKTLNLDGYLFFRIAYLIGIGSSTNHAIKWGAPFFNLTISPLSFNSSTQKLPLTISFENHAHFAVNGRMQLKMRNSESELVETNSKNISAPSGALFFETFELTIDPVTMPAHGVVEVYFDNVKICDVEVVFEWIVPMP
jgi:hypothetical protein